MQLSRLGEYIELVDNRNTDLKFNQNDVRGISTSKVFIKTKADLNNVNLSNYKVVNLNEFAYVADTSRRGEKIGLAYVDTEPCIISSIYTTFKVKDENKLMSKYLMMYFKRPEFDRYARFNSWGSARETFSWEDFCDIELVIPPIEIQKKYVDVYESLLHNLKVYESKLDDLKLVCDGYIEEVRKKSQVESIGKYIVKRDEKNLDGEELIFKGIGLNGIIEPNQTRTIESMKKCNIFYKDDFIYAPSSFKNGVVEYNDIYDKALCTEEYRVFYIKDKEKLNPYYLLMWLKRKELGRSIDFYVIDSVRNRFQFDNMKTINIPIPDIQIQNDIAKIYNNYRKRLGFVKKIRNYVNDICPMLIKGAIDECR